MGDATRKSKNKKQMQEFYATRREWTNPDIIINPIGTLVIHNGKEWICAPWIEQFMMLMRKKFLESYSPRVMLSLPAKRENAGSWDLVMLASGLSKYFGKKEYLWPEAMPLSAIVALRNIGYPPGVSPATYIESIPDRVLSTVGHRDMTAPGSIIYWRPSDGAIQSMNAFGLAWRDEEDALLDIPNVQFAGQPEDVIAVFAP
jgi:hypothetical protein